MINRKHILRMTVLMLMVSLAAPLLAAEKYTPQPISKTERCPVCGMYPANYPKWHAQIVFKDGKHSSFDSQMDMFRFLHNMAKYDKKHRSADIGKIFVMDYAKEDWLDAKQALFVSGSKAQGPMGKDLPAFSSKEEAEAFAKKSGGKILNFQQVTPAVTNMEM